MTSDDFIGTERIAKQLIDDLEGLSALMKRVQPVLDAADVLGGAASQLGVLAERVTTGVARLDAAVVRIPDLRELTDNVAMVQVGLTRLETTIASHSEGISRLLNRIDAINAPTDPSATEATFARIEQQLALLAGALGTTSEIPPHPPSPPVLPDPDDQLREEELLDPEL